VAAALLAVMALGCAGTELATPPDGAATGGPAADLRVTLHDADGDRTRIWTLGCPPSDAT
jgi:hypothetical protein